MSAVRKREKKINRNVKPMRKNHSSKINRNIVDTRVNSVERDTPYSMYRRMVSSSYRFIYYNTAQCV